MKQNRLILSFRIAFIAFLSILLTQSSTQAQTKSLNRIVIDPGHGGTDPGAYGRYSTEAAVSLAISLKLEKYIKQALPEVDVVLTRTTDIFNNVVEKAEIANQMKGDLFVCIHTNSAQGKKVREIVGYTTKTYTVKKKGKRKKSPEKSQNTRQPICLVLHLEQKPIYMEWEKQSREKVLQKVW